MGVDLGAKAAGIVRVNAIEPFARERQKRCLVQAEHPAPARREVAAVAHEVPVPQAVVGGERRERVPLFALAKCVTRTLELVVETRHLERAARARASLPDEPPGEWPGQHHGQWEDYHPHDPTSPCERTAAVDATSSSRPSHRPHGTT